MRWVVQYVSTLERSGLKGHRSALRLHFRKDRDCRRSCVIQSICHLIIRF